jgi:purine-nucleoside phosphorylase
MIQAIEETAAFLQSKGIINPEIGIVLGTGLNALAERMSVEVEVSYHDIPNFVPATVAQHKGRLLYGTISGKKVLLMQGRLHAYEGHSFQQITFPIRVMKWLGVKTLLLSNAAGGLNLSYKKGDLMLLTDHINLQNGNPLIGKHYEEFGARFPDMSQAYSEALGQKIEAIAAKQNIGLHKGVYVVVTGPMLETRAEYRFLRMIGADVVGMSTVPEVIVAHQMGVTCAAISVVTDECDPDNLHPVNIDEIVAAAQRADGLLANLYSELIMQLQ